MDSILFHCPSIELVEVLARSTHINIEDGHIYIRIFITNQHGMLRCIHTANLGAIALSPLVRAAGPHALDKYDGLGSLVVGHTLQMALGGSCRVHDTLQLQGRDDIRALVIRIFIILIQLDGIKAGRHDDSAVIHGNDLVLLLVINRARLTYLGADTAFSGLEFHTVFTINHRNIGNRLGEGRIDRASCIQSPVEFIGSLLGRTLLLADAAAGTLAHIHASGFFPDIHMEIAYEAADLLYLAICINRNLLMGRGLHHFRCQDTGGAVQSREGLVKL